MNLTQGLSKPLFLSLGGAVGLIEPTFPFAFVLAFAIALDCYSAFDLGRRLKKKRPDRVTGKFRSEYALKMLVTFLKMYGVILLVSLTERYILYMHDLKLTNYVAAVCCFVQLWSVLENFSSASDGAWAKTLQKIMINKAERHFDIKIDLDKKEDEANGRHK